VITISAKVTDPAGGWTRRRGRVAHGDDMFEIS